jgi:hypothetical protein
MRCHVLRLYGLVSIHQKADVNTWSMLGDLLHYISQVAPMLGMAVDYTFRQVHWRLEHQRNDNGEGNVVEVELSSIP